MRMLIALILMCNAASAGYIDFQGSGGTASYDGVNLAGTANISFLAASGTLHDGIAPANAVLTFTQSAFTLTGNIPGVTGNEVLFSGLWSFGPVVTHPPGGDITFILSAGTGTLASNVASYYGVTPLEFSGLSVTVKDVGSTTFTNGTVSSTDFSVGASTVPEPSSFILVGLGLIGVGIYRRK